MYENLIETMRFCAKNGDCHNCPHEKPCVGESLYCEAADVIEELSRFKEECDGCGDKARSAIEKLQKKTPHWIPVTERMPEKSGDYLVFDDCGNLYVNEWHFPLRMWQYDDSRITHWMPLPEPPEED